MMLEVIQTHLFQSGVLNNSDTNMKILILI